MNIGMCVESKSSIGESIKSRVTYLENDKIKGRECSNNQEDLPFSPDDVVGL